MLQKPFAVCPKCGQGKAVVKEYRPLTLEGHRCSSDFYGCTGEHLHYACDVCGYTIAVACADAEKGKR